MHTKTPNMNLNLLNSSYVFHTQEILN
uniref:Uncharacterized protein n=1 Tax=Arundo donax TaxID=35708 RepID=A0A0A8YGA4_ARUDO